MNSTDYANWYKSNATGTHFGLATDSPAVVAAIGVFEARYELTPMHAGHSRPGNYSEREKASHMIQAARRAVAAGRTDYADACAHNGGAPVAGPVLDALVKEL